jgi:hypothetical protein
VTAVQVPLSNGGFTLVDPGDVVLLRDYGVPRKTSHGYVKLRKRGSGEAQNYLHRVIMGARKGEMVDHINRDRLDNRRANLRLCTNAQNMWNSKSRRDNASGLRGVWESSPGHWSAAISVNEARVYLGTFWTKHEAAIAFQSAEKVRDTLWSTQLPSTRSQTDAATPQPDHDRT